MFPSNDPSSLGPLRFIEVDVPYNDNYLSTGSFRSYYYNPTSLLAFNRICMIHLASSIANCLSFDVAANGSFTPGSLMSFKPCVYNTANSQPASKLQLFKAIRQCSATGAYVFRMWAIESGSQETFASLSSPDPYIPCMAWNASSGTVVQMPCMYDNTQQWTLSSPILSTQSLCPAATEATFTASNAVTIMSQLAILLHCPATTQNSWSKAAAAISSNPSINASVVASSLPPCFKINLLEIQIYDGGFLQSAYYIGGQDPFLALDDLSMAEAVSEMTQTVFDLNTSGWTQGTSLMFWLRAVDVTLNQPSSYLSNSSLSLASNATMIYPLSLLATTDYFAISCNPGTNTLAPSSLPAGLYNPFKVGIRNLSIQGCGVGGTMPAAWPSMSPLATGRYVNQYPVMLSVS